MSENPKALCFHGGEDVLSLFFKGLSKLKPIQVRITFGFLIFVLKQFNNFSVSCFTNLLTL